MSSTNFTESASSEPCSTPNSHPNSHPNSQATERVVVTCDDRWQVYHRLKMLDIDCQCGGFQPLQVTVKTPMEAFQLWSVVRRVSSPRAHLVYTLESCWKAPSVKS